MTQWATLREQWLAWAEEPHVARHPCVALDAFDDELRTLLTAAPFGQRVEVTQIARLGESMPFDNIPTLVRGSQESAAALIEDVEDDDPDAASTLVRGARPRDEPAAAQLDVSLQTPGGGLQIELEPAPPSDAQAAWYIPALTGSARAAAEDARQPPPPPPELDTGGTVVAPAPTSPSGTIQIDPATTFGAEAPMAFAASPIMSDPVPVRSGTTLIPIDGEAGSSRTAGVIEVAPVPEPPPPPPRRPSKIVIAPSVDVRADAPGNAAPSVIAAAYDESGEFARVALDAPASETSEGIGELEPELIESADLLESVDPPSRESPPKPPSPKASGQMRAVESPPPPPRAEPTARTEPGPPPAPPPRAEPTPPRPDLRASEPPSEPPRTSGLVTGQTLPPTAEPHWSSSVFGEHFFALARPGADRIAVDEAEFVVAVAGVGAGASVIDVGCGDGHHAAALAERGMRVLGLEASPAQIHRASENFGPGLPNLRWLLGDVRQRPVSETFDLVTCLGTSFGHYDEGQNRVVLESLRDLCRPGGGRLVLHVLNRDYVVPRLPARSWWQGQGCLVLDEVEMQDWASRLAVRRTIVFEDGRQFEHAYTMRAYALHELAALVESVGLRVLEASGSRHTRGRFFGATSPDIWLSLERR